jgi:Asp-tRNA(Asn)/Glu-tRNA(Gln) amidotransferase A subunit family amidase
MTDSPWLGDACSLVDAFRAGDHSPAEELEATLNAIERSETNSFSFVDAESARAQAAAADLGKPFGGVPFGIKELSHYKGWPDTEASLVFADRVSDRTETMLERAEMLGGVIPVGLTTASEFGGLNVSVTKLNGVTRNPWQLDRTAGGSSGGSSAAVAGGLLTMATGGDGGGSIRIPAGFNGLPGMKGTAGRIPRGPKALIHPMTVVLGVMCRSIRDITRYFDVTAGYDSRDPYSLPKVSGWEHHLGSHLGALRGRKVAIVSDLGSAVVNPAVTELVNEAGRLLADEVGLEIVHVDLAFPSMGFEWALGNLSGLYADLEGLWPECKDQLTPEIAFGMSIAERKYSLAMMARSETARTAANEAVASAFDQVDFIFSATNPDVAFPAETTLHLEVAGQPVGPENNGALTIPYNIVGNPSLSVPIGQLDGLPVGMQIASRHHQDALVLDLGLALERSRPWPLVANAAPC